MSLIRDEPSQRLKVTVCSCISGAGPGADGGLTPGS